MGPNEILLDIQSRRDNGEISKDITARPYQQGSNSASRSEGLKRTAVLDHYSPHADETINQQAYPKYFDQHLDRGATDNHQSFTESELSQTLLHLYDSRSNFDAHAERAAFFSALDITQSERCGEYFIGKFGEIVAKYNAVRRQRRDIATALEAEIANREKHVHTKKEMVDQNLNELKQAGKGVVRGKTSLDAVKN